MIQPDNIKPLTDFLRNSKKHIAALKESGEPEVLTVNGEATVVVQDTKSYQEMANWAQQARDDERLRLALEAFRNGDSGKPLEESRQEILQALRS
ncbi:MAG: type II toxin-antitoxin system Phd/YefM family antitoxin [Verrucomicrobiota bacterium]